MQGSALAWAKAYGWRKNKATEQNSEEIEFTFAKTKADQY